MVAHASLTGSDLHETKGASSASADTVHKANGSGATSWSKVTSANMDTTSVFNVNKGTVNVRFPDIGAASSVYIPFGHAVTITKITTAIQSAVTGADTVITAYNAASQSMGTITVSLSGTAAGDVDSLSPSSNNTVSAGSIMRLTSDGGATNSVEAIVSIDFTWTA